MEEAGEMNCGITLCVDCHIPLPHPSPTLCDSWEILTLKAYCYEECNCLVRFCFAQDQCILQIASKFLRTHIHLMEQIDLCQERSITVLSVSVL